MADQNQSYTADTEWSHPVDINDIENQGKEIKADAPEDVFDAVARRLNLDSIKSLCVTAKITRNKVTQVININAEIEADVVQNCVVTGAPVQEYLKDEFECWYAEPSEAVSFAKAKRDRMSPKEREEQPMLEEYDDPEQIVDGKIDLGELAVQHLSLSLNPYPRCQDARSNFGEPLEEAPEGTYNNPFAALKDWKIKEKLKNKND